MASVTGLDPGRQPSPSDTKDTVSSRYPDRPIRPMPKRRIRSRLSDEQAGTIDWPLTVPSSSPSFGSPQSQNERSTFYPAFANPSLRSPDHHTEHYCDCGGDHYRSEFESEEEELPPMRAESVNNSANVAGHPSRGQHHSPASSADGYESFENTNNKKKRKIPIAGLAQPGSLGEGNGEDGNGQTTDVFLPYGTEDESGQRDYPSSSGASGIGISGAGRGRSAKGSFRSQDARRPLAASTSAGNAGATDNATKLWGFNGSPGSSNQGIIATAMSKAAGKGPVSTSSKGQENQSLLQRQQGASNGEAFTFQCPSDSSGKMTLTHRPNPAISSQPTYPPLNTSARPVATQGTQTSPNPGTYPSSAAGAGSQQGQASQPPLDQPRKPRRPGREYAAQARHRQMQQDYNNYHHPPRREDVWICEFCEYEAIFGRAPSALIRQYEIKDYKERKIAEERRRLLEKAKAKSRNKKKGAKGNKNNGNSSAQNASSQRYDQQYDELSPTHPDDPDEYLEDDYDDRLPDNPGAYDRMAPPPPVANATVGVGTDSPIPH